MIIGRSALFGRGAPAGDGRTMPTRSPRPSGRASRPSARGRRAAGSPPDEPTRASPGSARGWPDRRLGAARARRTASSPATWCSPRRRERERAARRHPRPAHLWMLFVRPPLVGDRARARRSTRSPSRRRRARATSAMRLFTPAGQRPRAGVLRARGLEHRRRAGVEPHARRSTWSSTAARCATARACQDHGAMPRRGRPRGPPLGDRAGAADRGGGRALARLHAHAASSGCGCRGGRSLQAAWPPASRG